MRSKPARRRHADPGSDGAASGGMIVEATGEALAWAGFRCALVAGRLPGMYRHLSDDHAAVFHLRGTARVEVVRGGRLTRFIAEPGGVTILPAGIAYEIRADRPVEVLGWSIATGALGAIVEREWGDAPRPAGPAEAIGRRDAELWGLGKRLAGLLREPRPGARLYAEALSNQIALRILWSDSARDDRDGGPTTIDSRLRQAVDYIQGGLGGEITLGELADVSGLSPGYFAGAFKRALGRTPHRYVIERRVARACELLEDPHRPIIDVAMEVGFSSQSHLTSVFRKIMKTTPAAYRQEVLGMGRE